jgi:hypothetical protein
MSAPQDENESRRLILDRAERLLRQSRALRKMSEELHQESRDIRKAASKDKSRGRKKR